MPRRSLSPYSQAFVVEFAAAPFGCWQAPRSNFSVTPTTITDFDDFGPAMGIFSAGFLLELSLTTDITKMDVAMLGVTDWDRRAYGKWDARPYVVAPWEVPAAFAPWVFRSAGAAAPFGSYPRLEFFTPTYLFQLPSTLPLFTQYGDFSRGPADKTPFATRCPYTFTFQKIQGSDIVQSVICGAQVSAASFPRLFFCADSQQLTPHTSRVRGCR